MWLRLILGIIYLGMAVGQTLSAAAMPGIIGAYDVVPGPLLIPFVVVLIAAEAVTGLWLLARPRSTSLTPVWMYAGVSMVWTILAVQAFARGLDIANCGCFGVYLVQPLRWWVLLEDGLLLVYAVIMVRSSLRLRAAPRPIATESGSVHSFTESWPGRDLLSD
ncbi:hypothetical protein L0U85_08620 [Glycomyces sp. L485]|uniref:MauE/DoxX family redox-associated membrane protein n=1 Tax=Glycomyces sp. L485 TaxID=2909235 RepID=UPI001F4A6FB9|nr:MauE/DoxX family redox-associated membrane protein [Glycomyces sp. L485]MCH7230911.1 hypothetical protein [Glycomyces sp. L485]